MVLKPILPPFYRYESSENMTIQCSTKVCSFGKQVVEKVETEYARFEGGRFVYKLHRSPMCEYMINFILKLKHLPEKYMMNSVLENFTILQVQISSAISSTLFFNRLNYASFRWSPIEILKRLCCASRMSLRSPLPSTVPSTTSTNLSKTSC